MYYIIADLNLENLGFVYHFLCGREFKSFLSHGERAFNSISKFTSIEDARLFWQDNKYKTTEPMHLLGSANSHYYIRGPKGGLYSIITGRRLSR